MKTSSEIVRDLFANGVIRHMVATDPDGWGWHIVQVTAASELTVITLETQNPIRSVHNGVDGPIRQYQTHEVTVTIMAKAVRDPLNDGRS